MPSSIASNHVRLSLIFPSRFVAIKAKEVSALSAHVVRSVAHFFGAVRCPVWELQS